MRVSAGRPRLRPLLEVPLLRWLCGRRGNYTTLDFPNQTPVPAALPLFAVGLGQWASLAGAGTGRTMLSQPPNQTPESDFGETVAERQAQSQVIGYLGDMNRDFLLKYVAEAERHITETAAFIQQRHEIIARLRENGSDTTRAERLLDNTFGVLAAHERYLAHLRGLLRHAW